MPNVLCAFVPIIIMRPSLFMSLMCVVYRHNTHIIHTCAVVWLFSALLIGIRTLAHLMPRGLSLCVIVPNKYQPLLFLPSHFALSSCVHTVSVHFQYCVALVHIQAPESLQFLRHQELKFCFLLPLCQSLSLNQYHCSKNNLFSLSPPALSPTPFSRYTVNTINNKCDSRNHNFLYLRY